MWRKVSHVDDKEDEWSCVWKRRYLDIHYYPTKRANSVLMWMRQLDWFCDVQFKSVFRYICKESHGNDVNWHSTEAMQCKRRSFQTKIQGKKECLWLSQSLFHTKKSETREIIYILTFYLGNTINNIDHCQKYCLRKLTTTIFWHWSLFYSNALINS